MRRVKPTAWVAPGSIFDADWEVSTRTLKNTFEKIRYSEERHSISEDVSKRYTWAHTKLLDFFRMAANPKNPPAGAIHANYWKCHTMAMVALELCGKKGLEAQKMYEELA